MSAAVVTVEVDEMWHYPKKGLPSSGSAKLRVWRAYDLGTRRLVAWVLGGRDDATSRRLLDKIGLVGKTFVTDDWKCGRRHKDGPSGRQ